MQHLFAQGVLVSLAAVSCQPYEPYTREEVFKGAFAKNFTRIFGEINPSTDWDFAVQQPARKEEVRTRTSTTVEEELDAITSENYFVVNAKLFNDIKNNIGTTEKTDRSFAFLVDEDTYFDIYPVYLTSTKTGLLQWVLQMYVGDTNLIVDTGTGNPGWPMGTNVKVRTKAGDPFSNFKEASICNEYGVKSKRIIRYAHHGEKQLMHFDLYITGSDTRYAAMGSQQSCLNYQMRIIDVPKPDIIGDNLETLFVACDAADMDVSYPLLWGNRYQSLVFMIVGRHLPEVLYVREDEQRQRWIDAYLSSKRYMIEDLGSASDFDFNDVVVDVEQSASTAIQIKQENRSGTSAKRTSISFGSSQVAAHATVRFLCGTRPFRLYVGNDSFGQVTDPTDQPQTRKQLLKQELNGEATLCKNPDHISGWEPNVQIPLSEWDPETNKVSIEVWPNGMNELTQGGWIAQFPSIGAVPFIMALPTSTPWSQEGVLFTAWQKYILQ